MKALFTTKEVAKILNISVGTLNRVASPAYKDHPFYLKFSGGRDYRKARLYPRNIVKAKLMKLGESNESADEVLSAFDAQSA